MAPDISNENSDNTDWRNKLEAEDSLSMYLLADKQATWDTLHRRLQARPRRKVVSWYWAAAAILILVVATGLFFSNRDIKEPAVFSEGKIQLDKPVLQPQPVTIAHTESTAAAVGNQRTNTDLSNRYVRNKQPLNVVVIEAAKIMAPANVQPAPMVTKTLSNDSLFVNKATVSMAAMPTMSKRLKVVHINELGYPVEESHEAVPPSDYGAIRFGLGNQQAYAVSASTSTSNVFHIPKEKSNSTN